MSIDTRNKVPGQSNLNAQTGLTFTATEKGGNVIGSENLMIDGTGNPTNASDRMLCPFSAGTGNVIPGVLQHCPGWQAGRSDHRIGDDQCERPVRRDDATNPVVLNYAISVRPVRHVYRDRCRQAAR